MPIIDNFIAIFVIAPQKIKHILFTKTTSTLVSPEVGKSSWWSEIVHVNLELMWDQENIEVWGLALPSYAVEGGDKASGHPVD